MSHKMIQVLPQVDQPQPVDLGEAESGFQTLLGVLATIGPYVFLGGVLCGALFLVIGMFGHGELKGAKYIVISIVAAVIFGAGATLLNLFV